MLGQHPDVLKYWGRESSPDMMLILEYHPTGSLLRFLTKEVISFEEFITMGTSLASGESGRKCMCVCACTHMCGVVCVCACMHMCGVVWCVYVHARTCVVCVYLLVQKLLNKGGLAVRSTLVMWIVVWTQSTLYHPQESFLS